MHTLFQKSIHTITIHKAIYIHTLPNSQKDRFLDTLETRPTWLSELLPRVNLGAGWLSPHHPVHGSPDTILAQPAAMTAKGFFLPH